MTGMDLVEFLTARLDEDERVARRATAGPWEWQTIRDMDELVHPVMVGAYPGHPMNVAKVSHEHWPATEADKAHIARHDPASVLADVEAKRAILSRVAEDGLMAWDPRRNQSATQVEWHLIATCRDVLKLLALPYADHPDYRPEWKP